MLVYFHASPFLNCFSKEGTHTFSIAKNLQQLPKQGHMTTRKQTEYRHILIIDRLSWINFY